MTSVWILYVQMKEGVGLKGHNHKPEEGNYGKVLRPYLHLYRKTFGV